MNKLKQKLLNLGIFLNNEYLDFYLQKILESKSAPSVKGKTEKHHIIPRLYYKSYNLKVDNSKNNIVNLTHFDHCLCHYFLCLCLVDKLKYKNEHAFIKMVNIRSRFDFNYDLFITQATLYNQIYEDFINKQSEKAKIRFKNGGNTKGKHYYTNGIKTVCRESCPKGYWSAGNRKGKKVSLESRQHYSEAARKRTTKEYIHKMSQIKQAYYKNHSGTTANRVWVSNGIDEKLVNLDVYYLEDGWYIGRSTKSKLKNVQAAAKGRKIYNEIKKTK